MIRAGFKKSNGFLTGFDISGHAGYADSGQDIVCAAVSSAVQLTLNLLAEFGFGPEVNIGDNIIKCSVAPADGASRIIDQLEKHLGSVLEEFPKTIKITISEV
ncbi:MAG: ribosomal-processing cysteine protease Prp [Ruminococcus sp.]|jgi:hypothetical protein|nr:ribosomal-processing cysteine protease Prp [Ruminococcus sp.]